MLRLGFSSTSDVTCGLFRGLDDRGSYSYEELAQLRATAPAGPLTGVWMSPHTMPLTEFPPQLLRLPRSPPTDARCFPSRTLKVWAPTATGSRTFEAALTDAGIESVRSAERA